MIVVLSRDAKMLASSSLTLPSTSGIRKQVGGVIVALSRDAKVLAIYSLDSAIHIWNTETGVGGRVIVVLSRSAKMLASSSLNSAIHIRNTETGERGDCSAE